jgi:hypothetical protein
MFGLGTALPSGMSAFALSSAIAAITFNGGLG